MREAAHTANRRARAVSIGSEVDTDSCIASSRNKVVVIGPLPTCRPMLDESTALHVDLRSTADQRIDFGAAPYDNRTARRHKVTNEVDRRYGGFDHRNLRGPSQLQARSTQRSKAVALRTEVVAQSAFTFSASAVVHAGSTDRRETRFFEPIRFACGLDLALAIGWHAPPDQDASHLRISSSALAKGHSESELTASKRPRIDDLS